MTKEIMVVGSGNTLPMTPNQPENKPLEAPIQEEKKEFTKAEKHMLRMEERARKQMKQANDFRYLMSIVRRRSAGKKTKKVLFRK
jgi:hypothetical protein